MGNCYFKKIQLPKFGNWIFGNVFGNVFVIGNVFGNQIHYQLFVYWVIGIINWSNWIKKGQFSITNW